MFPLILQVSPLQDWCPRSQLIRTTNSGPSYSAQWWAVLSRLGVWQIWRGWYVWEVLLKRAMRTIQGLLQSWWSFPHQRCLNSQYRLGGRRNLAVEKFNSSTLRGWWLMPSQWAVSSPIAFETNYIILAISFASWWTVGSVVCMIGVSAPGKLWQHW